MYLYLKRRGLFHEIQSFLLYFRNLRGFSGQLVYSSLFIFLVDKEPKGVVCDPPKCVSRSQETLLMKRNGIYSAGMKLQVEVRVPVLYV